MSIVDRNLEDLRAAIHNYVNGAHVSDRVWSLVVQVQVSQQLGIDGFNPASHGWQLAALLKEIERYEFVERQKEIARQHEQQQRQAASRSVENPPPAHRPRGLQSGGVWEARQCTPARQELLSFQRKKRGCELALIRKRLTRIAAEVGDSTTSEAIAAAKADVEQLLQQLRKLYTEDKLLFREPVYADIGRAKLAVGIITREELQRQTDERHRRERDEEAACRRRKDEEEAERHRQRVIDLHKAFLDRKGIKYAGMRESTQERVHRKANCYSCKVHLDNRIDYECIICDWILCGKCGACGCGYQRRLEYDRGDY